MESRDVETVIDRVRSAVAGRTGTRWIGVDGGGAAGKTTLAARLHSSLEESVVVHVDDFARPGVATWDHDRFLTQLVRPLRAGEVARYQRWDWASDTGQDWVEVPPGRVMIVEGVSSTDVGLGIDWDLTIWVEAPRETRLARALARDGEAMRSTWLELWLPEEDAYVAAQQPQQRADLVVSGGK